MRKQMTSCVENAAQSLLLLQFCRFLLFDNMHKKVAVWICVCGVLSVMVAIISVVTNSWIIINRRVLLLNRNTGIVSHPQGLWIETVSPSLISVQFLMLAGIITTAAGTFYCFFMALGKHNKPAAAVILFVIAGLCFGIALILYSILHSTSSYSRAYYGYSYVIGWLSVLCAFMLAMTTALFH